MRGQSTWLGKGEKDKTTESWFLLFITRQRVLQEASPCRPNSMPSTYEELHKFMCSVDYSYGLQFLGDALGAALRMPCLFCGCITLQPWCILACF